MAGLESPLDRFRLDDRVVLLTGASSGLGQQFARSLAGVGARLALVARRRDRLERLADELGGATVIEADLADPGSPDEVVARTLDDLGRIDVVVNNAGISRVRNAVEDDMDEFRRELEIDLVAPDGVSPAPT